MRLMKFKFSKGPGKFPEYVAEFDNDSNQVKVSISHPRFGKGFISNSQRLTIHVDVSHPSQRTGMVTREHLTAQLKHGSLFLGVYRRVEDKLFASSPDYQKLTESNKISLAQDLWDLYLGSLDDVLREIKSRGSGDSAYGIEANFIKKISGLIKTELSDELAIARALNNVDVNAPQSLIGIVLDPIKAIGSRISNGIGRALAQAKG